MIVNGETTSVEAGTSVEDLVELLFRSRAGLAVAVNNEVVPRSQWAVTRLRENDRVEVLTAAQGG